MNNYPLTMLYDGTCPVCVFEMNNLKARNAEGLLRFVNISSPGFAPEPYGTSLEAMNALIHAQRADGSLVIGVEVFRLAYGAVGLGRWAAPTGWPILRPVVDVLYALFARHRYRFSRWMTPWIRWIATRGTDDCASPVQIAAQQALLSSQACKDGMCDLPASSIKARRP
jgi:predicted DCC family thiol-disulfide oxidoreductase YuxK